MTTPEPTETDAEPILGSIRPSSYRLFLAGVGLYVVTRERLGKLADNWMARAERLEAERHTQLQQKLAQLSATPTASAPAPPTNEPLTASEQRSTLPLPLLGELPTQTEIQTLNQRLDNLLTHLDNLPPNS
jgi:polyhydroxyalkanoate synthesis regulator phasin